MQSQNCRGSWFPFQAQNERVYEPVARTYCTSFEGYLPQWTPSPMYRTPSGDATDVFSDINDIISRDNRLYNVREQEMFRDVGQQQNEDVYPFCGEDYFYRSDYRRFEENHYMNVSRYETVTTACSVHRGSYQEVQLVEPAPDLQYPQEWNNNKPLESSPLTSSIGMDVSDDLNVIDFSNLITDKLYRDLERYGNNYQFPSVPIAPQVGDSDLKMEQFSDPFLNEKKEVSPLDSLFRTDFLEMVPQQYSPNCQIGSCRNMVDYTENLDYYTPTKNIGKLDEISVISDVSVAPLEIEHTPNDKYRKRFKVTDLIPQTADNETGICAPVTANSGEKFKRPAVMSTDGNTEKLPAYDSVKTAKDIEKMDLKYIRERFGPFHNYNLRPRNGKSNKSLYVECPSPVWEIECKTEQHPVEPQVKHKAESRAKRNPKCKQNNKVAKRKVAPVGLMRRRTRRKRLIRLSYMDGNTSPSDPDDDAPSSPIDTRFIFQPCYTLPQVKRILDDLKARVDDKYLAKFLESIPRGNPLKTSEVVLMAEATLAFRKARYCEMYEIMEENFFSEVNHKELQNLWYEAHYKQGEEARGRPLCAVDKFRIRAKFPPPKTIWDGEKLVYCFKEKARNKLKQFYDKNQYPNKSQKNELATITGLSLVQIRNWFKNRRQREKYPNKSKTQDDYFDDDLEEIQDTSNYEPTVKKSRPSLKCVIQRKKRFY